MEPLKKMANHPISGLLRTAGAQSGENKVTLEWPETTITCAVLPLQLLIQLLKMKKRIREHWNK